MFLCEEKINDNQKITECLLRTIVCVNEKILFQHGLIKYIFLYDKRHNPLLSTTLILCF